jgi:translation initiation factor 1 (eIF-1/SUI1)
VPLGKSHDEKNTEDFVEDFHIIIHKKIKIYHINKRIRSDVGINFGIHLKQTNTKKSWKCSFHYLIQTKKKTCGSSCTLTDSNLAIDEYLNMNYFYSNSYLQLGYYYFKSTG